MSKLGDFLRLEDGRKYVPGHVERKPNDSSRRASNSGLGRAVLSSLVTLFGGCGVYLSIVGMTGWADWGFIAPNSGGPPLGLDLFTLTGPFAWIFPLVLSLAVLLFGLHLLTGVVKDTVRKRPRSREDTRGHSVTFSSRLESIVDGDGQESSSHSAMGHPQQEVTPSGHAPKQEPRLARCPCCRSNTFHVVAEAGNWRCSSCYSVLPTYLFSPSPHQMRQD